MQPLHREPGASAPEPTNLYRSLSGTQHLNDVVLVDQSPIGRTPRSNPVTYIKAFDEIRALFAAQPDAKRHGFGPGAFSFNVPGGRCDTCEGDGTVTVEMQFLADIELPCEECNGTRYKSSILDIKYKGRNIHDVLNMTVKEALCYFAGIPRIVDKLAVLDEVGLGYVRLGQSATTLSGGEAQRVKLASHLATARAISIRTGSTPDLFNNPAIPPPRNSPPAPAAAPSTSSTSPPPASTSTTSRNSSPPSASSSTAAAPPRHRTQSRRHQVRRLGHRPRPRRRRRRRPNRRHRNPRSNRRQPPLPHRPLPRPHPRPHLTPPK